jgi:quercetin dioxygenase-like cupin family protein
MNTPSSTSQFATYGSLPRLEVFGVEVEVLLDGGQSDGRAAVYRVTAPPGAGAPRHRHPGQDELFHVLEGEFELYVDGVSTRMRPGDHAYAPRGAVHAFVCEGEKPGLLLVMSTPAGHEAFFRDCAAAVKEGRFSPARGAEICRAHGIELVAEID